MKKKITINLGDSEELLGANDTQELQNLERISKRNGKSFMEKGVKFADVNRVDFKRRNKYWQTCCDINGFARSRFY